LAWATVPNTTDKEEDDVPDMLAYCPLMEKWYSKIEV